MAGPKKKTTALAKTNRRKLVKVKARPKRPATALAKVNVPEPEQVLAKAMTAAEAMGLGAPITEEGVVLGSLGCVELKLTDREEGILSESVNVDDIRVKPTKSGTIYLPHIAYRRWFNRAFGRTGWNLRPVSKPQSNDDGDGNHLVVVQYLFMVHGLPIAQAYGEQTYKKKNAEQSFGDAIESTDASALRRVAKRLGVGLELWDKIWCDTYLRDHCVFVKAETDSGPRKMYRRKIDPPFDGESSVGRAERRPPPVHKPAADHPSQQEPITDEQLSRLFAIANRRGRSEEQVKSYLKGLGYASRKAIKRKDYETIISAIEHPGPMDVIDVEREPGMEG